MKISNEYVKINTGNREVTLNNLILDLYISVFVRCQFDLFSAQYYGTGNKYMYKCYIKLDTPLEQEIKPDMFIYENSFDIYLQSPTISQVGNANAVSVLYGFSNKYGYFDEKQGSWINDYHNLGEHKITAIAFGNNSGDIFAILDTTNYDLDIPKDSVLSISRKDNFSTDATIKGADFPLHLAPLGIRSIKEIQDTNIFIYEYGLIYSVGLGVTSGIMQEEYIVGEDVEIKQIDDFSFKFILQKSTDNTYYPYVSYQPTSSKFPTRYNVAKEIYPNSLLYTSTNKYPLQSTYKYIIMKYKGYYVDEKGQIIYTGKEYTMSIYSEKKGLFDVITKIERNDK